MDWLKGYDGAIRKYEIPFNYGRLKDICSYILVGISASMAIGIDYRIWVLPAIWLAFTYSRFVPEKPRGIKIAVVA